MAYKKLIIFDVDGTLVNSIDDVVDCFNESLVACGFPSRDYASIASLIGKPLETIVAGLIDDNPTSPDTIRVAKTYREVYAASPKSHTAPYPGMDTLVEELLAQGVYVAANSNKPHENAVKVLERLFPGCPIKVSGYGDVASVKPSPEGALKLILECGVTAEETLYVGDTLVDVETASNAQIDCVIVTWGQGNYEQLRADPRVSALVDTAAELKRLCMKEEWH